MHGGKVRALVAPHSARFHIQAGITVSAIPIVLGSAETMSKAHIHQLLIRRRQLDFTQNDIRSGFHRHLLRRIPRLFDHDPVLTVFG